MATTNRVGYLKIPPKEGGPNASRELMHRHWVAFLVVASQLVGSCALSILQALNTPYSRCSSHSALKLSKNDVGAISEHAEAESATKRSSARPKKIRLDTLLVSRGIAQDTREAAAIVLAGHVFMKQASAMLHCGCLAHLPWLLDAEWQRLLAS